MLLRADSVPCLDDHHVSLAQLVHLAWLVHRADGQRRLALEDDEDLLVLVDVVVGMRGLARLEEEKREAEQNAKYTQMAKVGFGSQIRNYFLHPDQRVKDARTGYLVGSFNSVLDGNIQGFLDAYLRWRVGQD